jgi:hypothetical protein
LKVSSLKSIQVQITRRPQVMKNRAGIRYSCWLCNRKCMNMADYLIHLQAHKNAIERQRV